WPRAQLPEQSDVPPGSQHGRALGLAPPKVDHAKELHDLCDRELSILAIEQPSKARRRETLSGHAYRHAVGLPDRLHYEDARLRLEHQQSRNVGWCVELATFDDAMPSLSLLLREIGAEAGALSNGIADERILHERTVAAHNPHKPALRQLRDRAPCRV